MYHYERQRSESVPVADFVQHTQRGVSESGESVSVMDYTMHEGRTPFAATAKAI
jgi:hypothetical protein